MRKRFVTILLLASSAGLFLVNFAEAAVRVRGHVNRSTGTYVAPHYRSLPNHTRIDNYSTKGNYNPFTGKKGYTSPYKIYRFR